MAKDAFTVAVYDPHSISIYDVATGGYRGIIYVTSGSIIGNPIVTAKNISVTFTENGKTYISTYEMPSRAFLKKIAI